MSDTSDSGGGGGGSGSQIFALNTAHSPTSNHNSLKFVERMAADAKINCMIVQVKKCTVKGVVGPIGRVDVIPLVQMIDGKKQTVDHVTVYNLPYLRIVGGKSAVILDPKPDDIGLVVTANRDISGVKKSLKMSPPGSKRSGSYSDGMYMGSVLTDGNPESWVQFMDDGTIQVGVDKGNTFVQVKKDEIESKVSDGTSIFVSPGRVDLGKKNAPHAVVTVDGPSTKVFAVISESGP
jgi:hypothetical protein